MEYDRLAAMFGVSGVSGLRELNNGHINRTFLVTADGGDYVLQSLNRAVFASPETVMANIAQVEAAFAGHADISVPHFLLCNGRNYAVSGSEIWRMYAYCEGLPCEDDLFRAGEAYGGFIRIMSGSGARIQPAIEGFLDLGAYFSHLGRVCPASEIPRVLTDLCERLDGCFDEVPRRIIHGDAKPDNIVVGKACTVLDLDTVMVGAAALDYGDLVRSVCTRGVDADAVEKVTRGFITGLGDILSDKEKASLYDGILWTTGELALRYLTDHYSEERYFRGKTRSQCLERARGLIGQLDEFLAAEDDIRRIIAG